VLGGCVGGIPPAFFFLFYASPCWIFAINLWVKFSPKGGVCCFGVTKMKIMVLYKTQEKKMNKKIGMYSSIITFAAVFAFACTMLLGLVIKNDNIGENGSYFSSLFIMLGFIPMICSYLSFMDNENKSLGFIALSFSIMYGLIITIVYFTQLTTVRLTKLAEETAGLLDYSRFGLFFNYDLLGYGFMALSTFLSE
jgi:uncharacterized membrane protein